MSSARLEWHRRRQASADCSCRDSDRKAECCSRRRYSTREDREDSRGSRWWRPEPLENNDEILATHKMLLTVNVHNMSTLFFFFITLH